MIFLKNEEGLLVNFTIFSLFFTIQVVLICGNYEVHLQNKRRFARYFAVSSLTLSIWLKVLAQQQPARPRRRFEMFGR